ncbi:hypothetical protein C4587_02515 [Candidatus Parcubacteria bacterium]|nr:MAG: hypothetical protein C4587_02515 [Candidatus Parcubacteria bacterium]
MKPLEKVKSDLNKKFKKVLQTPASFDFFVAIHGFIEHIELNVSLSRGLSPRVKANRDLNISSKYDYLKQIYQGLEDISVKSNADLGHARYSVIRELNQIQSGEASESNSFWKKRELFRKLTGLVYGRLDAYLASLKAQSRVG